MKPTDLPRWDLSVLYAGPNAPEIRTELAALQTAAERFAETYQHRVASLSAADLMVALGSLETLLGEIYRPQAHASLLSSTDALDDTVRAMNTAVSDVATEVHNRLRFFDLELASAPEEVVAGWMAEAVTEGHRHHLRRARESAPHVLSTEVERVIATKNLTGRRAWSQLYTEVTAGWEIPLEVDGETRTMNLAQLRALRTNTDREIRRRAHQAILDRFERESPLFAYILNTLYQDHRTEGDLRKYTDPVAPTLLDDEIDAATLHALMSAVEAHYPVAQAYFGLKARALGLEKLMSHDVLAPYPMATREVSWTSARDLVLKAFGALHPEVADIARRFFTERRIDAEPRAGKQDGAFCAGMIPGTPPYVLLNYTGNLHDVLTLAHELGHGVHFVLAGRRQSLVNYWPTTPMAETASVFAEMVLTRDLLSSERDPAVRRQLLATRIEEALGTIHRQVCFTRYEIRAHARRAEGVVPAAGFSDLWAREHDRLYGTAVERTPGDAWGWAAIPHLVHYRFYCYAYAFGQLLVFSLYRAWEENPSIFVPRYLDLLASGGSESPAVILSRVGIDITDPTFWARGLEVVTRMVEDFRSEVVSAVP